MSNLVRLISLYYQTLRHLTARQIYHQVVHRLKKIFLKQVPKLRTCHSDFRGLRLLQSIPARKSYLGNNEFCFLNKKKRFESEIDWNFSGFEKLWAYNLNYFEFLHQEEISVEHSCKLIDSFCSLPQNREEGIEPYPISLRGINWIKFFVYREINNAHYNSILYSHYRHLANNIEYHLMGNHLLENGFSLLYGAYYFKDKRFYKSASRILYDELSEQILNDGAHFELSPMYHQIILFRLLDSINLIKNNFWSDDEKLIRFLENTATKMLGWIEAITFRNGDVPMVNDATIDIAPSSSELLQYAERLGLGIEKISISDSGYRMIRQSAFELFIDIGNIGPDYIPGHAHSDTFNFLLYVRGLPVLVDTGITTYSRNSQRIEERSTRSHNTVKVNGHEQSDVWASFRVGRRAKVKHIKEVASKISAIHNGFEFLGLQHQRIWQWNDQEIKITDEILGDAVLKSNEAYFHFHPNVDIKINGNEVTAGSVTLLFSQATSYSLDDYNYSMGFNQSQKAKRIAVSFREKLETTIVIED